MSDRTKRLYRVTATYPDGREGDPAHLFHGDPVRPKDAEYLAAMHPGIALALADWLDDADPTPAALAVARAISGGA